MSVTLLYPLCWAKYYTISVRIWKNMKMNTWSILCPHHEINVVVVISEILHEFLESVFLSTHLYEHTHTHSSETVFEFTVRCFGLVSVSKYLSIKWEHFTTLQDLQWYLIPQDHLSSENMLLDYSIHDLYLIIGSCYKKGMFHFYAKNVDWQKQWGCMDGKSLSK